MELELRHLRAFVVVAEERHFGKAAERLHVSQPPLSRQIRRLEQELGTTLLDRSTRPIRLTTAGAAFYEEAALTLDQARRAVERGRRAGSGELGQLSIGALPWAYNGIVPPVLRAFGARLPDVRLELDTVSPAEQVEDIQRGRLDVGFSGFAQRLALAHALEAEPLVQETMVALVPQHHPIATRAQVSLEELAAEPRLSMSRLAAPALADEQAALFRQRGLSPRVAHEATDIQGLLGLVAAGVGVALHLESSRNLHRSGVAFVPLEDDVPPVTLHLLWRSEDDRKVVRAFVETAREVAESFRTDVEQASRQA